MLCEAYIEALLVDEDLADQLWDAWNKGEIDDQVAWWLVASVRFTPDDSQVRTYRNSMECVQVTEYDDL